MKNLLPFLALALFCLQCEKELSPVFGEFTDTRDGYTYRTVEIGSQVWFAENLRYLPKIYPQWDASPTEKRYYVEAYDGTNVNEAKETSGYMILGVYYNRPAALESCPDGWHMPSEEDWEELVKIVGKKNGVAFRSSSNWPSDQKGNNSSGFNMLPFCSGCDYCSFWSTGQPSDVPDRVYTWGFPWTNNKLEHDDGDNDIYSSLRCIKD